MTLRRPQGVLWLGVLLIGGMLALAAYDIVGGYRVAVADATRQLNTQARIIAEQTARSIQAVDVLLRHIAQQYRQGDLDRMGPRELHNYLRDQSVGIVQIDGLLMLDAQGRFRASSRTFPVPAPAPSFAGRPAFEALRAPHAPPLAIEGAAQSPELKLWVFPIGRRLETPAGAFAGVIGARGRIDYYQRFYSDISLDPGTNVVLMHQNGSLLARHPPADALLGQRIALFDERLAAAKAGKSWPDRTVSPVDGVERFSVMQLVPGYPIAILVTRDVAQALAPWRAQAVGAGARTLALGALAALLLWLLRRQIARLEETRRSLEISQERFALAVAGSDDGIFVFDFPTRTVFSSARGRELSGLPPKPETQDMDAWFREIPVHPEDAPRRLAAMQAHLDGKAPAYDGEFRLRQLDGSYRWIHIHGVCSRDAEGKPLRMAGSISDVDDRKRAEEALRASEEHYRAIFNASADALVLRDPDAKVVDVNPAFLQLTGLTRAEITDGVQWFFALPESVPRAQEMHRRVIAGESVRYEIRTGRRDGSVLDIEVRAVPIQYRGRTHSFAMARDITARKQAEVERASLEGQLLQAKKLEAIGTLAGGIAHDFNNILSAILGYGEMAQKGAAEGTPLKRHVDAVVAAGLRAKSLVERILAFSRSGIGERVPVNVQAVVAEALELARASLPAHVRLEQRLDAGDATILGDATQIHQVVMNLCANAAQAMKAAGTLTVALDLVEKDESRAATSALTGGRYVRLSVRDTGSGIPRNVLERIFDPFFTTKDVGVGTGLGLSLVHGIVTDLGGGIDVDSAEGAGTTFSVYLPCGGAGAAPAIAAPELPAGAGETILLVDDEEPLVRLGEELIASLGYEPVGFTSSTAALAALRADPGRFDAVLSDESMPELTGSELAREIRRLRPDIPIVLMSGFVSPALAARAGELGLADILAKPLASKDIARSLAAALRA